MAIFVILFFTSLFCFVSLILTIIGGVKKIKKLLYGGIAGFFVFGIATVVITVCSVVKVVESVTTEDVAEAAGEVSERGGKIAGKVVKGSVTGMANELEEESIKIDSSVVEAGIVVNHCENLTIGERVSIYLDFTKDFEGVMKLYAYDVNDKKQGVASDSIHVQAGDEGTYVFDFNGGFNSGFSGYYKLVAIPAR